MKTLYRRLPLLAALIIHLAAAQTNNLLQAEEAIKQGANLSDYSHLKGHPLYPYLQYRAYRNNLSTTQPADIVQLLNQYPNAPFSGWLAEHAFPHWLQTGQNNAIIQAYHPEFADDSIECQYRLALIQQNQPSKAYANLTKLWDGTDPSEPACQPLFNPLIAQNHINQTQILERLIRAIQTNNDRLATYLAQHLPKPLENDSQTALAILRRQTSPTQALAINHPQLRSALLALQLQKQASEQTEEAYLNTLEALRQNLWTNDEDKARALNPLTRTLARQNDPRSLILWRAIPKDQHDNNTIYDLIAYLQRQQQWHTLTSSLSYLSAQDLEKAEINYWLGKAHEKLNQTQQAIHYYQKAATQRDLFGFLAAEKLGQPYQMNDKSIIENPSLYQEILSRPEAYRLQVWLNLGNKTRATQEYKSLIKGMDDEQLKQAALFIHQPLPLQAITTLTQLKYWDALNIRFPTPYQDIILKLAQHHQLSPATIYAIIRKESIFQPDIKSHAGALGLMQVMPATARDTAKRHNIPYQGTQQLTDINTNLQIGSQYLADRLKQYGHLAYAAAAYNAGPQRVNRWLAEYPNLPLDEWIAQIPFSETRDYVKRVLEYQKIYEYRLGLPQKPFNQQAIQPY